jgi:hypothetical protein
VAPATFRDLLARVAAHRDPKVVGARAAAYAQYGDDPDRELAAFAAGSHPLQRTCTPGQVEETARMATESFSRVPARPGVA